MPQPEETIAADIERLGWIAISVRDIDPPFLYTVGLMQTFDHPEAIVFGLEPNAAHSILAVVVANLRTGRRYKEAGEYEDVLDGYPISVRLVHPLWHEHYFGYAMGFCREIGRIGGLQAIQLFWPDRHGRSPFESNCDLDTYRCQPRLDLPPAPSEQREMESEW